MVEPQVYVVTFSRCCPHGIWLSRGGRDRRLPVRGSFEVMDYSEQDARAQARFILDGACTIDSVRPKREVKAAAAAEPLP